jgi:hypothetical protein
MYATTHHLDLLLHMANAQRSPRSRYGVSDRLESTGTVVTGGSQLSSVVDLARDKHVLLVADPLYFSQYAFHEQKLILPRPKACRRGLKCNAGRGRGRDY